MHGCLRSGLLVPALLLQAWCFAQDPPFVRYTTADGLPGNAVYAIHQDQGGDMWFGTDGGVARFNGSRFERFGLADGLTDNEVIGVQEDREGRIWFLQLNGEVCFWQNDTIHNPRTDPWLGRHRATMGWQSMAEDAQGRIWLGGGHRDIRCIDPRTGTDSLWQRAHSTISVGCVNGEVRVFSQNVVLKRKGGRWDILDSLDGEFFVPRVMPGGPNGDRFLSLHRQGILELRNDRWEVLIPGRFDRRFEVDAWMDRVGDVWLRLRSGELFRYAWTGTGYLPRKPYFINETVGLVFVDREGGRWFATQRGGVIRCTRDEFEGQLFRTEQVNGGSGQVLFRDRSGAVWMGTTQSALHRFKDGLFSPNILAGMDDPVGRVLGIVQTPDGMIWIAADNGVLELDPVSLHVDRVPVEVDHSRYSSLHGAKAAYVTPEGRVLFAYRGLHWIIGPRGNRKRRWDPTLPRNRIDLLCGDGQGRLWFGVNELLHRVYNGHDTVLTGLAGHFRPRISDIRSWRDDTLLVATSGGGLKFLAGDRVIDSLTTRDGLISDVVDRVRVCGDTLLVCTKQGFQLMVHDPVRHRWRGESMNSIPVTVVSDAMIDHGRLLAATREGLCVVPLRSSEAGPAPHVRLDQCILNGSVRSHGPELRIGTEDRVALSFIASTFDHPEMIRYAYRLSEEDAWTDRPSGNVDLSQLAPGHYDVQVRASRSGGAPGPAVVLGLTVVPPWYAGPWALFAIWMAAALLLLYAAAWSLRRQYARQLKRLAELNVLNEERRRIAADVHDDLGADLSHLLVRAQNALDERSAGEERKVLRSLAGGLRGSMEKIDEIIWSLDPGRDNLRSTADFIENWVRTFAHAHGLGYRSEVVGLSADVALHAVQRRELALVVKEAVRNIVRHAQATTVLLGIRVEGRRLYVVLEDDGRHSPLEARSNGRSGLVNMQRRAERLGGRCTFIQRAPQGTKLSIELGLDGGPHLN